MMAMAPGNYVLYMQPHQPTWPSVICTDDMAPRKVRNAKPHTFCTLILVISKGLDFRWALPSDIKEFDPSRAVEDATLMGACERVWEAMDSNLGLKYWKEATKDQRISRYTPSDFDPDFDLQESDGEMMEVLESDLSESEDDIKTAIKRSLLDCSPRFQTEFSTQSSSPKRVRQRISRPHLPLSVQANDIRQYLVDPTNDSPKNVPGALQKRFKLTPEDFIDDEISKSHDFVEFVVGEQKRVFSIFYSKVKDRAYLSNPHAGTLVVKGETTWSWEHPCLKTFTPDHFQYFAEYLESGEFGCKVLNDENRTQAVEECANAWVIGERLCADDFLEHIATKLEKLAWSSDEVLAFIDVIYKDDFALIGNGMSELCGVQKIKAMFSDYMANNFFEMIDKHGSLMVGTLQEYPELEFAVFSKLAERAQQKIEGNTVLE